MVVTDKNDVRRMHHTGEFLRGEHSLVCAKRPTEIPQILLAATAIRGTNLSLYTDQSAQLRFVSPRSESGWTPHVMVKQRLLLPLLDLFASASLCSLHKEPLA